MGGKTKNQGSGAQTRQRPAASVIEPLRTLPDAPQQLIDEPPGGYDYQYLNEHRIVDYHYLLGALQHDRQRALQLCSDQDQREIVEALYYLHPRLADRQVSLPQLRDILDQRQAGIGDRQLHVLLDDLVDSEIILHANGQYFLTPELTGIINSANDPLIGDYYYAQNLSLLQRLPDASSYYQLRGALSRAHQLAEERAPDLQSRALLQRLHQALGDKRLSSLGEQLYEAMGIAAVPNNLLSVEPEELLLGRDAEQHEIDQLAGDLERLADQGLIIRHSGSQGTSYGFLSPQDHDLKDSEERPMTKRQKSFLIENGPEEFWRAQGAMHQAARRAQAVAADRGPIAERVVANLITAAAEVEEDHDMIWPPRDHDLEAKTPAKDLLQTLNQDGQQCSEQQLAKEIKALSRARLVNSNALSSLGGKLGDSDVGLRFEDSGYRHHSVGAIIAAADHQQRQEVLAQIGPEQFYFRCGQAWESRKIIEGRFNDNDSAPRIAVALARSAVLEPERFLSLAEISSNVKNDDWQLKTEQDTKQYLQRLVEEGLLETDQSGSAYRLRIY